MKNQRRKHTAEFKAKVALEALKGMDAVNQIAAQHQVRGHIVEFVRECLGA